MLIFLDMVLLSIIIQLFFVTYLKVTVGRPMKDLRLCLEPDDKFPQVCGRSNRLRSEAGRVDRAGPFDLPRDFHPALIRASAFVVIAILRRAAILCPSS